MIDLTNTYQIAQDFGFILKSFRTGSYAAMFFSALLVGYVIPIPEVVVIVLAGYFAATGAVNLSLALIVIFGGILLGDIMVFYLAKLGSRFVDRFNQKIRNNALLRYEKEAVEHIEGTIYFLRLLGGFRFLGPVFAGTMRVEWQRFFWASAGASMLHTAFFLFLGYQFSHKIWFIIAQSEILKYVLMAFSPFVAVFLVRLKEKCSFR